MRPRPRLQLAWLLLLPLLLPVLLPLLMRQGLPLVAWVLRGVQRKRVL